MCVELTLTSYQKSLQKEWAHDILVWHTCLHNGFFSHYCSTHTRPMNTMRAQRWFTRLGTFTYRLIFRDEQMNKWPSEWSELVIMCGWALHITIVCLVWTRHCLWFSSVSCVRFCCGLSYRGCQCKRRELLLRCVLMLAIGHHSDLIYLSQSGFDSSYHGSIFCKRHCVSTIASSLKRRPIIETWSSDINLCVNYCKWWLNSNLIQGLCRGLWTGLDVSTFLHDIFAEEIHGTTSSSIIFKWVISQKMEARNRMSVNAQYCWCKLFCLGLVRVLDTASLFWFALFVQV